jgi:hypothetical protein
MLGWTLGQAILGLLLGMHPPWAFTLHQLTEIQVFASRNEMCEMSLPLAQAKNGDQQFWNIEIAWRQWEGSSCTHDGPCFFSFWGGWWGSFFFKSSFLVLNVFLTCSPRVPFRFPK